MPFVPMLFDDIVANLVNWITGQASIVPLAPDMDLSEGSIERSQLEAVAVQLESQEMRTAQAVLDAIPSSCFHAFGFDQLPAIAATGAVIFTALTAPVANITIPSGTRLVSGTGQAFVTLANVVLVAGTLSTPPVFVQAEAAGALGNVPSNSITTMVFPLLGVDLVTNPAPTIGGRDPESDESRAQRFSEYVQTLQRGTANALEYAVTTNTAAIQARVIEPFSLNPVPNNVPYAGVVWLFFYDGWAGLVPTSADQTNLISTASQILQVANGYTDLNGNEIPGWKAAGVQVTPLPAQLAEVNVRGTVTLLPNGGGRWDQIQANLTQAVKNYFNTLRIGDPVCYQTLAAALNTCDSDVVEVVLQSWVDHTVIPTLTVGTAPSVVGGGVVPGYPAPLGATVPMAQDLDPMDPNVNPACTNNPYAAGTLCIPNLGTSSVTTNPVTYPEWVLA